MRSNAGWNLRIGRCRVWRLAACSIDDRSRGIIELRRCISGEPRRTDVDFASVLNTMAGILISAPELSRLQRRMAHQREILVLGDPQLMTKLPKAGSLGNDTDYAKQGRCASAS